MNIDEKFQHLKNYLQTLGSVVVAFSGGVDSTFLLKVAHEVLGKNVLAVTARSSTYPVREYESAKNFADANGISFQTIISEELEVEGFAENPTHRCYLCKKELFSKLIDVAAKHGIKYVIEGSNFDDTSDYRPGLKAIAELGIISPLREAQLTKEDIRYLSKEMGLPTWNKPSFACLSSRFPYGQKITVEKLTAVDQAEQLLLDLGFTQVRVRHHGDVARIEILTEEFSKLLEKDLREEVYQRFKEFGFQYVSLDLKGYRTGSMNEVL